MKVKITHVTNAFCIFVNKKYVENALFLLENENQEERYFQMKERKTSTPVFFSFLFKRL